MTEAAATALSNPRYTAFGHGTMTAGIVHLVAPTAKILPLKAFSSSGSGYLSDVLRAIYYATAANSKVISMSFSFSSSSAEMSDAINYAYGQGVICVASAGNNGEQVQVLSRLAEPCHGRGIDLRQRCALKLLELWPASRLGRRSGGKHRNYVIRMVTTLPARARHLARLSSPEQQRSS